MYLRSNEKRITELEKKVGIIYDPVKINYWQELNNFASRVFLKEFRKKCVLRHSFTLPEHLRFAREIFYRLVEFYKKLYQRVLSENSFNAGRLTGGKPGGKTNCKVLIAGFGWVLNNEFNKIKLALLIRTLAIEDDIRRFLLCAMPENILQISGRLAELQICL